MTHKLVPIEPTEVMIKNVSSIGMGLPNKAINIIYKAMLEAAPDVGGEAVACSSCDGTGYTKDAMINLCANELSTLRAQLDVAVGALERLHKTCEIALKGKQGEQFSYFETRAGSFVYAADSMRCAEKALETIKQLGGDA